MLEINFFGHLEHTLEHTIAKNKNRHTVVGEGYELFNSQKKDMSSFLFLLSLDDRVKGVNLLYL
jgi:hypothetical protein